MKRMKDRYAHYVEHPRYGRGPRFTGLNPNYRDPNVNLHWNATCGAEIVRAYAAVMGEKMPFSGGIDKDQAPKRIANTAIVADLRRQTPATIPVTHYFDVDCVCCDCRRPFIFFAAEQKFWYEELGFPLEVACVRCVLCRKRQQGLARCRERYEELCHLAEPNPEEVMEMAECSLALTEEGLFGHKQLDHLRAMLKRLPTLTDPAAQERLTQLQARLQALANQATEQ